MYIEGRVIRGPLTVYLRITRRLQVQHRWVRGLEDALTNAFMMAWRPSIRLLLKFTGALTGV